MTTATHTYRCNLIRPAAQVSALPISRIFRVGSVPPVPHDRPKFIMASIAVLGLLLAAAFQASLTLLR